MEPKHIAIGGVLILILVGLLWLAKLLPGFGFGLGDGKGEGKGEGGGPGNGSAADVQKAPPPGTEEIVVVSEDKAALKSTNAVVTPEQLADWAKAGRKFVIQPKDDAQVKIMEGLRNVAKQSDGRIVVKE